MKAVVKAITLTAQLMLVAVLALLATSVGSLLWGVGKAWKALVTILQGQEEVPLYLIQTIDAFLIAIVLFIFAASIYELFIGKLDLPTWIPAHNLSELKVKLSSIIVLLMAIEFLSRLLQATDSSVLLNNAISIALVSATLIVFMRWSDKPIKNGDQAE